MLNSIAILGRPNVGKSSLFNKLTKTRNAIVSDFSGLTKDRNFGYASIKDQQYLVIDTGGVGSESTEFSAAIAEQALIAAEDSDLILLLIDGSEELTADDIDLYQSIRKMNKKFFGYHSTYLRYFEFFENILLFHKQFFDFIFT